MFGLPHSSREQDYVELLQMIPSGLTRRLGLCLDSPICSAVSLPGLPADSPQCRVLLGSVSLFFSYPQREGNLIPSHAPNLTKHGRKKAVTLKFKPLSFCYHRQCQGPRHGFEDVSKHVKFHHGESRHRASTMQKYACRVADNIARYL